MAKVGRKVGYRKPDPNEKGTITLPPQWWDILRGWKRDYGQSHSQSIHTALENLKIKVDGGAWDSLKKGE